MQRYRGRQCGHTFTLLSGTPLVRLRYKKRWLTYSEALLEGLTVRQAARWIPYPWLMRCRLPTAVW
jgi:transposase-like protein